MPFRYLLISVLLLISSGCGGSPAKPSPVNTPESPGTPAPASSFSLTIDGLGSEEAIAAVSNVTVDASASTGAGLRYAIAFGDGETAATALARHVYQSPGPFTVTVTITDATGRETTSTRQLVVASPLGRWVHSGFIERRQEVEVRTLTLVSQTGTTLRGTLTRDGNRTIPVTATVSAERSIRVVLEDGSEVLEGAVPSAFSAATTWPLTSRGGSIDGQSLTFAKVAGDPSGAAPDAVLKMRFFSFGAPFAVKQISPVLFDGTGSRGEGLTYYLEFGDGQVTTDASATHPMQKEGKYVARLTVVDRYGRSDSETREFEAWTLVTAGYYNEWSGLIYNGPHIASGAILVLQTQEGTNVSGVLYRFPDSFRFIGTVNADGQVQLQFADPPATLTGRMTLTGFGEQEQLLELTFHGGPFDGQIFSAYWRKNY
jgi:PKD repeat protein